MVHNPVARGSQPRYLVNGKERPKGVTTILGATLAKDLMQWAVDCMSQYLEAKLPVVTGEDLKEGAKEYTRRRDSGASTGTEAHAMVELFLKNKKPDVNNASKEALNAYNAFVEWFNDVGAKVINVEEVVYSEEFEYAGTYDAMLEVDGKVLLTDFKTTNASRKAPNGVYAEYFIQLGAYYNAHEEQRQFELANGGTKLVKVDGLAVISGKKNGKLDVVTNEHVGLPLEDCADMFKYVCNVYRFLTSTTKVLGGR